MGKRAKEERGRYTAKRKVEAVMRLLKGDDLDTVSRELGGTRIAAAAGQTGASALAGA